MVKGRLVNPSKWPWEDRNEYKKAELPTLAAQSLSSLCICPVLSLVETGQQGLAAHIALFSLEWQRASLYDVCSLLSGLFFMVRILQMPQKSLISPQSPQSIMVSHVFLHLVFQSTYSDIPIPFPFDESLWWPRSAIKASNGVGFQNHSLSSGSCWELVRNPDLQPAHYLLFPQNYVLHP